MPGAFASGLEEFIRVLGFVNSALEKYQRKRKTGAEKFAAQLRAQTMKQLGRIDPAALPDAKQAWQELLDDIAATAA